MIRLYKLKNNKQILRTSSSVAIASRYEHVLRNKVAEKTFKDRDLRNFLNTKNIKVILYTMHILFYDIIRLYLSYCTKMNQN